MTNNCLTKATFENGVVAFPGTTNSETAFSTVGELSSNNTGKPSFDTDQAAVQISRDNRKWDGGDLGTAGDVTYSFLSNAQAGIGYRQLSAEQMATSKSAMDILSSVANITFSAADNNVFDQGEIKLQGYFGGGGGWASWGLRGGGPTSEMTGATIALGGSSLSLALHEIGHAVGLSHPGNYNGGGFTYEKDAEFYQDSEQYTVMSYWGGEKTGAVLGRFTTDETGNSVYMGGATGLGLYDIAALQRIYGANKTTYTTDTTYGFNSNTGDDGWTLDGKADWIQAAIWDAGGNDTIDMSGYSENADIDLREESFSSTGGLKHNLAIAKGAVVENAVGGSGDDNLRGNVVANVLTGGEGNDTLRGAGGNDTLDGGEGNDTAIFSGNFGDYVITSLSDGMFSIADKMSRDGKDEVSGIETFVFADGNKTDAEVEAAATDAPIAPPVDPANPVVPPVDPVNPPVEPAPASQDETIVYEPGKMNVMDGGKGTDTADFSTANGSVYVDMGIANGPQAWGNTSQNFWFGKWEIVAELKDVENLTGSDFDDFLSGDSADNTLIGGKGSDLFDFAGDFGNDTIGDFTNGEDLILFYDVDGLNRFDQLDIKQKGEDAVVSFRA